MSYDARQGAFREHTGAGLSTSNGVWGSDVVADIVRTLGYRYIALVLGSSYHGLHDSLVNHLRNHDPTMIVCLHEERAVAIADDFSVTPISTMRCIRRSGHPWLFEALTSSSGLDRMPGFSAYTAPNYSIDYYDAGALDGYRHLFC